MYKATIAWFRRKLLIPTSSQYSAWSLPSKLGLISFWVGIIGLLLTLLIFIYQEKLFNRTILEILVRTEPLTTNVHLATDAELEILPNYPYSEHEDACNIGTKPEIALVRSNVDVAAVYRCSLDHELVIFADQSTFNRPLDPVFRQRLGYVDSLTYTSLTDRMGQFLYVGSIHGANGRFYSLNLIAKDFWGNYTPILEFYDSNEEMMLEDVDGDGVKDLLAVTYDCRLEMHKIVWSPMLSYIYKKSSLNTHEINSLLKKTLVGTDFKQYFDLYTERPCSHDTESGDALSDEDRKSIFEARKMNARVVTLLRGASPSLPSYKSEHNSHSFLP